MRGPAWLIRPRIVIRMASFLVPAERREEWSREWLAELHYAQQRAGEARSFAFARGAFHDAMWQQRDFWTPKRTSRVVQSPWFCLASLAAILALIALASGILPMTRMAVLPLPYSDAGRVATIAQAGTMATRAGVLGQAVDLWRNSSQTLESIATYRWEKGKTVASVSANFFAVLGAKTTAVQECQEDCAVLSYDFWRGLGSLGRVTVGGKHYRVAAVAGRDFWFLSPQITMWRIESSPAKLRSGVVARLRRDVTAKDAESELGAILRASGMNDWESILEITGVENRVRSVFWLFALGLGVAVLIVLPSLRMRMPAWNPGAAAFFAAKTAMALAAVLLCGIEFTRASSITMLGGADGFTVVSMWWFVMGSMGALVWSIADQRRRCRVCLRRLGMAAHVGCPGCMLLDWAGTELVCVEGHGMLHVPEMVACWQEPDRWTSLDETWQGLFERG